MAAVAVSARPSARPQDGCKAVKGRLAAADGCKESIKHGVPGKLGAGGLSCRGTDRSCQVTMSALPQAAKETSVLIVGTGLTGSLACYHLRALARKQTLPLRIHVADMARGPGGRMSTTRFGPDSIRANTGAQCLSAFSPEAAALLESACAPASACPADRVSAPLKRSTHFTLRADDAYAHWLPEDGTNAAVKRFLYGGEPDLVVFESRLQRMTVDATPQRALVPLFDSGGTTSADGGPSAYDVVILAMPPKDIVKFFAAIDEENAQSQADLHRRTNRGRSAPLPSGPPASRCRPTCSSSCARRRTSGATRSRCGSTTRSLRVRPRARGATATIPSRTPSSIWSRRNPGASLSPSPPSRSGGGSTMPAEAGEGRRKRRSSRRSRPSPAARCRARKTQSC